MIKKCKRIALVLACSVAMVASVLPVNATGKINYASFDDNVAKAASTITCGASGCSKTASFSRYGKITNYRNITDSGHEECIEAFYYCSKGHTTVKEVWIGTQSHSWSGYDDLGHSSSGTHHYRVKCNCGYGNDVYIICEYSKNGVHAKPF